MNITKIAKLKIMRSPYFRAGFEKRAFGIIGGLGLLGTGAAIAHKIGPWLGRTIRGASAGSRMADSLGHLVGGNASRKAAKKAARGFANELDSIGSKNLYDVLKNSEHTKHLPFKLDGDKIVGKSFGEYVKGAPITDKALYIGAPAGAVGLGAYAYGKRESERNRGGWRGPRW